MQPIYTVAAPAAPDDDIIAATQTPLAGGNLTLVGSPSFNIGRQVLFTFGTDETGRTFVVYGKVDGVASQETVAGAAATAVTTQFFSTVTRITIDAASAGTIKVGTNGLAASDWKILNWDVSPINVGLYTIVSGTINFTVQVTMEDPSGTYPNPNSATNGYNNVNEFPYAPILRPYPTPIDISALASKAANTEGSITTPYAAYRVKVNSFTAPGQVTLIALQAGIKGN